MWVSLHTHTQAFFQKQVGSIASRLLLGFVCECGECGLVCVREKEGERDVARITFVRNDSSTELDKEKMRQRGGGVREKALLV